MRGSHPWRSATTSAATCVAVCAPIGAQHRNSTAMRRFGQPENDGNARARGIVAGETRTDLPGVTANKPLC